MSDLAALHAATETSTGADDLDHIICPICNPDLALCGTDVTNHPWIPDDAEESPDDCLVCDHLSHTPHHCGWTFEPTPGAAT